MFDFAKLFFGAILVRNLYTGDPYEGVQSLPPQSKSRFAIGLEKQRRFLSQSEVKTQSTVTH